jgi:two-component system KDP operon response regulator KdpE
VTEARRILVVEDDSTVRQLCATVLREEGYRVETAVDGRDALDRLDWQPDLILLDLAMPVMDGHEFLSRFRARRQHRRTSVLIISANHRGAVPAGAQGVLEKPFAIDVLAARVSDLLQDQPATDG